LIAAATMPAAHTVTIYFLLIARHHAAITPLYLPFDYADAIFFAAAD